VKKDRFIFGSFSGIAAGIIALLTMGMPAKFLGLTDILVYDYGMIILLARPKYQFLDYVVGFLAHLMVSGISGTIFAVLIYLSSRRYLFVKGFLCGAGVWFFLASISTLYKVPMIMKKPAQEALVTLFTSGYWGLITAFLLNTFYTRIAAKNKVPRKTKIRKYHVLPVPSQKKRPENNTQEKSIIFKRPKKARKI
jgi:hypothetical protein